MVISVSNSLTQKSVCNKKPNFDQKELEKVIFKSIKNIGLEPEEVKWNDQGHLEIKKPNNLKLHTLMLQMEKLGLDLKMTKQTLIEIT